VTELVWTRDLDVAPAVVWPHLVVPEKMSVWSRAPIALVDEGDGGVPWGVGALRRVTLDTFGRKSSFEEVIAESAAPARLVYRVVRGLPVREHEGVQTLEASARGSRLVWRVRFEPIASPLGFAASRLLDSQMRSSLDVLERVVREAAPSSSPGTSSFADDEGALAQLERDGARILGDQRALAESLRGDPKYWFSRVYEYVTEEQLRFVRERASHPVWVLRLLPVFHRFYFGNFEAHRAGRNVEAPWRVAFGAMDRARKDDPEGVIRGLMLGVRAHIEEDLPRALAEVWLDHYRGRCDYVRLRADYLRMADIFRVASARLIAEMPPDWMPPQVRLLVRFAPLELQDWAFARNYYDIGRARRKAFERGRGLAGWLAARRPNRAL
jgi:hypothetical protein